MKNQADLAEMRQRIENLRSDLAKRGAAELPLDLQHRFDSGVDWIEHATQLLTATNQAMEIATVELERLEREVAAWRVEWDS